MRSETAKRILSETSEETKQKVRETANKLVMDKDKELATALVNEYQLRQRGLVVEFYDAKQCAKLDLQHSIELLNEIIEEFEGNEHSIESQNYICQKCLSLRNQLEHLNSI